MNEDRIIIGESERAGLVISAPLTNKEDIADKCEMRWIQRSESFSLQYWDSSKCLWQDVPVIKE